MKNLISLLIIICVLCSFNKSGDKITTCKIFEPDTTVNNVILLENDVSISKTFGDLMKSLTGSELPSVYFSNTLKTQYLKLTFFNGNKRNCFSRFEIGYIANLQNVRVENSSNFDKFYSENGIVLGMQKSELLEKKGENYVKTSQNGIILLTYSIDDFDKSQFLKRYNMPLYTAEYWFKDNVLIKFAYGFEYP
ncbi:MAG: hypothetical protein LBN95_01370 [Prevotellaceae bacterium]|jgi:hypothetical protein|nr:hypothetical protein [Prevotellaceae bacterium]